MSKNLALSLLLIMLGLATWQDSKFDPDDWSATVSGSSEENGQLRAKSDGTPLPPCAKDCFNGCCS